MVYTGVSPIWCILVHASVYWCKPCLARWRPRALFHQWTWKNVWIICIFYFSVVNHEQTVFPWPFFNGKPWSWRHPLGPSLDLTEPTCRQWSAIRFSLDGLQLSEAVFTVCNCPDSLQLSGQSATDLTVCRCLNRPLFVPYRPVFLHIVINSY